MSAESQSFVNKTNFLCSFEVLFGEKVFGPFLRAFLIYRSLNNMHPHAATAAFLALYCVLAENEDDKNARGESSNQTGLLVRELLRRSQL